MDAHRARDICGVVLKRAFATASQKSHSTEQSDPVRGVGAQCAISLVIQSQFLDWMHRGFDAFSRQSIK